MNFEVIKRSHVKRNIIIGVVVVLVLSAIILTFTRAKYKITESMDLVNGTINYELSDFNLIGAYIQTEGDNYTQVDEIPTSGYEFNVEKSYCTVNDENINATLNYDMETQTLSVVPLTTKGTKCYLYFDEKASSVTDVIEDAYEENQDMLAYDETADNNLRYIGANPNNYVYFNCDDYNNPSSSTCELWRIIGIFNENSHGISGEKLVKIIKNSSLGSVPWDETGGTFGRNSWYGADLQESLNSDYLARIGDYNSNGIKDSSREIIQSVTWFLGATAVDQNYVNASRLYSDERGTQVNGGNATRWQGKIGLMYASDFAYATYSSVSNREACLNTSMYYWADNTSCASNSWLFFRRAWTITPYYEAAGYSYYVVYVRNDKYRLYYNAANSSWDVYPSLYLSSEVSITGGDGTQSNPYTLSN